MNAGEARADPAAVLQSPAQPPDWTARAAEIEAGLASREREVALAAARSMVAAWPELEAAAAADPAARDGILAAMVSLDLAATQPVVPEAAAALPARAELLARASANAARVQHPAYSTYLSATVVHREARLAIADSRLVEARAILEHGVAAYGSDRAMGPFLRVELADLLRNARDWSGAEENLDRAEKILAQVAATGRPDPVTLVRLLSIRSQLEIDLGLLDSAARSIEAARATAETALASAPGDPFLTNALGHALLQEGMLRLASDFNRTAVATFSRALEDERLTALGPEFRDLMALRRALAESHLAREASAPAGASDLLLQRALESVHVGEDARLDAELALAESALREHRFEDAASRLSGSRELRRQLREGTAPLELAAESALLSAWEARLARLRKAPKPALAAMLDGLGRDWNLLLDQWRAVEPRSGGVGFLHSRQRRIVLSEFIGLAVALEGRELGAKRALPAVLAAQDQGSIARTVGLGPTTIDALPGLVPAGGMLLIWCVGPLDTYLFEVDAARIRLHELPGTEAYEPQLEELERTIHQRQGSGSGPWSGRKLAAELAPLVLPESVRGRLRAGTPTRAVGTDLIGHLPMEALPLEDGRLLGEAVAIDRLPSIAVGVWLRGRAQRPRTDDLLDVLVVAGTEPGAAARDGNSKAVPFEFDLGDAERLVSRWPSARVRLWAGREPTADRLRSAELALASALYVVAHGMNDPTRSRPVGLALAAAGNHDGIVWAEDIETWTVPELVFLATCSAGRGQERAGEDGMSHLGGALLSAGARCAIMSRFGLEFDVSNAAAQLFFAALGRGAPPAEAMRAARAELASDPRFESALEPALLPVFGLGQ